MHAAHFTAEFSVCVLLLRACYGCSVHWPAAVFHSVQHLQGQGGSLREAHETKVEYVGKRSMEIGQVRNT
jgi:hypothetical protein